MIVTRFAPSPTGYLHIGGARTALFNWLLAKHSGGKFILRIEDTDMKRNTPTAMQQVIDDLKWLGIEWDEGPGVGGPNGPYLQSQRLDIYKKYLDQLLAEGKAYYCFDTAEELKEKRDQAEAERKGVVYRRPQTVPSEADAQKARDEGCPVMVRFAIPQDKPIVIEDIVRGTVTFDPAELSDFVIQKSDGFPTYHFAVVVDDELMAVTHVCRGQEHLMNTPLHQCLQKALGFAVPQYAHMSVTMSETGGKLSKRERPKALKMAIKADAAIDITKLARAGGISDEDMQSFLDGKTVPDMPEIDAMADYMGIKLPEINVIDFSKSGYLPETLVNFLALLGWSSGDEEEVMTVDELIAKFDINRFSKSNSLFDRKKLASFNTEHMRMVSEDKLLGYFKIYLKEVNSPVANGDDKLLAQLLKANVGARGFEDVENKSRFLFFENDEIKYDEKAVKKVLMKADGLAMLKIVGERLSQMAELTEDGIENMLRALAQEKQVGLGKVAQPLRVAICGNTISPPIFDSVQMLGKENTLARISYTLKKFNSEN